tara:strand:- start:318 stop:830 length:513 start_codon:yes stop_codon:yes gene_type:complete
MSVSDEYKDRVRQILIKGEKKRIPKPKKKRAAAGSAEPTEDWEHQQLVKAMRHHGLHFVHIPNEGKRTKWGGRKLFTVLGCRKAFPDFLVFDRPADQSPGVAIELKRVSKSSPKWGTPEQQQELILLSTFGWHAYVCRGYRAALATLAELGLIEHTGTKAEKALAWKFEP